MAFLEYWVAVGKILKNDSSFSFLKWLLMYGSKTLNWSKRKLSITTNNVPFSEVFNSGNTTSFNKVCEKIGLSSDVKKSS